MKRILMMVPLWRRPEITALFIRNLERTMPDYIKLVPLFILSPTDPDYAKLRQLTEGYFCTIADNEPLGEKKNIGMQEALGRDWDYFMDMGSDDLFTHLLWDLYQDYFMTETMYFGIKNMYVMDIIENRAMFVENYHINHFDEVSAIGPGRCVHRSIVDKCHPMWPAHSFGMDGYSDKKILQAGYKCEVIDNERLPVVLDLKSYTSLNPYMFIEDQGEEVDISWVREHFNIEGLLIQDTFTREGFRRAVYKHSQEHNISIKQAFDLLNECHRKLTGHLRYKNLNSFKNQ